MAKLDSRKKVVLGRRSLAHYPRRAESQDFVRRDGVLLGGEGAGPPGHTGVVGPDVKFRFAALALLAVAASATPAISGCTTDCGCEQRYRECIEKAPPGASRGDCSKEQDECEQACDEGRKGSGGAAVAALDVASDPSR
jgi:hypothetical protein